MYIKLCLIVLKRFLIGTKRRQEVGREMEWEAIGAVGTRYLRMIWSGSKYIKTSTNRYLHLKKEKNCLCFRVCYARTMDILHKSSNVTKQVELYQCKLIAFKKQQYCTEMYLAFVFIHLTDVSWGSTTSQVRLLRKIAIWWKVLSY